MAAGQLHGGKKLGMALKKIRRVGQKLGNAAFSDRMQNGIHSGVVSIFINTA